MTKFIAFLLIAVFSLVSADEMASYRELRYEGVVGQTEWFTCGPAALSTLFTEYYGLENATERELLELSVQAMQGTDKNIEESGVTALALKQVSEAKGIAAKGFSVTMDELGGYFESGGLPLLVHVTKPELHYVIAIGIVGDQIVIADPSFGRRILPFSSLVYEKGFSGVVLATSADAEASKHAKQIQAETLLWASRRIQRLASL